MAMQTGFQNIVSEVRRRLVRIFRTPIEWAPPRRVRAGGLQRLPANPCRPGPLTRRSPCEICGLGAAAILLSLLAAATEEPARPLSPEQEQVSFHLADTALTIELVAAEPNVVSPVAIAFDADGRLFVAEMLDYPNARTSGRIRLLEDRDSNGRYKTATVFADKLPLPNGVLPWKGGVLVTAAPDIWYLSDTNGDGRADEKRVLFTGFGLGNQQLRVNGLSDAR